MVNNWRLDKHKGFCCCCCFEKKKIKCLSLWCSFCSLLRVTMTKRSTWLLYAVRCTPSIIHIAVHKQCITLTCLISPHHCWTCAPFTPPRTPLSCSLPGMQLAVLVRVRWPKLLSQQLRDSMRRQQRRYRVLRLPTLEACFEPASSIAESLFTGSLCTFTSLSTFLLAPLDEAQQIALKRPWGGIALRREAWQ